MKVGLIYDPVYLNHETGMHVENKHRLIRTMDLLQRTHLIEKLTVLAPRAATLDELLMAHTEEHVTRVQAMSLRGGGWLDGDTVTSPESFNVALYAAGGVLRGVDAVVQGEVDSAFALVRPPGHHATSERAMGFCLFNNVAIAARYAARNHGVQRVLIADFDVHHGNGTMEIFYRDPGVLYFSTHEYPWYPGSGAVEEIGEGEGKGFTVNVPLPAYCGDGEFARAFDEVLVPVARRFRPQLILVSAGYDPHWADSISLMQVTVNGFGRMAAVLNRLAQELCPGKLVFALEGGYHLEALPHSIKRTLEVLLGMPEPADPLGGPQKAHEPPEIDSVLEAVKKIHGLG